MAGPPVLLGATRARVRPLLKSSATRRAASVPTPSSRVGGHCPPSRLPDPLAAFRAAPGRVAGQVILAAQAAIVISANRAWINESDLEGVTAFGTPPGGPALGARYTNAHRQVALALRARDRRAAFRAGLRGEVRHVIGAVRTQTQDVSPAGAPYDGDQLPEPEHQSDRNCRNGDRGRRELVRGGGKHAQSRHRHAACGDCPLLRESPSAVHGPMVPGQRAAGAGRPGGEGNRDQSKLRPGWYMLLSVPC